MERGQQARGHPAHPAPVDRHNRPVILLVTVATVNRLPVLASRDSEAALLDAWRRSSHWVVGNYVLMPDHVHLFCGPGVWPTRSVKGWVAYWKRLAGAAECAIKGAFVWDCWDTQMRNQDHYARKLEYVAQNPVREGLVERAEDWPFRGRLNELAW
jgi:putative transposase